jgi:hypothetical protein
MERKESPETYTLSLCSSTSSTTGYYGPLGRTTVLSNLCWRIDWENLFEGRQNLFDHCRVRFNLVNVNANAALTYNQNIGYLSAEFGTDYNGANTFGQTILGLISVRSPQVSGLTGGAFIVDGRNDIGVDINPQQLTGVQDVFIRLIDAQNKLMTYTSTNNFLLELMFELYN